MNGLPGFPCDVTGYSYDVTSLQVLDELREDCHEEIPV